uniref:Ig-like domain-containing protein n=1 Tax=Labrus bergylta TaxID=56723 RepID=A0A3Q3FQF2_9LABR
LFVRTVTVISSGCYRTMNMHSLKMFYTASSEVTNFPEFVIVGMVDDFQIDYYDSNTKRVEPRQDWMNKVTDDDADFWEWLTERAVVAQHVFKVNLDNLKRRFNQTGGVHIVQVMYGCEWDDETGDVNGYDQYGYDGEDFIVLDTKTMTWVAAQQQAVFIKQEWNKDKAELEDLKNYYTKECPDWLKKYVNYGRMSLLQKTPSSRVTCHATGFYPNRAMMFWRKDGEELHEDVDNGEILPNHDGSFQISADLQLPSDDWGKYDCVFQLSGVKEDIVTKLDKREIKTNYDVQICVSSIVPEGAVILQSSCSSRISTTSPRGVQPTGALDNLATAPSSGGGGVSTAPNWGISSPPVQ